MEMHVRLGDLDFNEYGEQPTSASCKQNLEAIGTVKDWVLKQGTKAGQTQAQIDATEALLVGGIKGYKFEPSLKSIRRELRGFSPGVWYIYFNTENGMDAQLYHKLADAAQMFQQLTNKEEQQKERAQILHSIERQMSSELMAWVMSQHAERMAGRDLRRTDPPRP